MLNEKQFFYILSYPRCRSTWFGQFLSTNVSHCFHEALSGNNDDAFRNQMQDFPRPYVGSADTNPISFARVKRKAGSMVLIYRPENEVVQSLHNAFDKHEAFSDDEWHQYLVNITEMFTIILDWYKEKEPNVMVVKNFREMEDDQVVMRIFKHCVPAYDPDWSYIRHMNNLKITLKNRKGISLGIDQSAKNRHKTTEEFKADHLERYDRDKFYQSFWEPIKHETAPILHLGSAM